MAWQQLIDTIDEAKAELVAEQTEPPVACPNDGELLQSRDGILHCPFDGYEWPRDYYLGVE